ncbi:hypothetical protein BH10PSE12_BH10PSE12_21660 [soil metagenome]
MKNTPTFVTQDLIRGPAASLPLHGNVVGCRIKSGMTVWNLDW